jgi:hypothetical protein
VPVAGKAAVFNLVVAQNFQTVNASVSVDGTGWPLENARLRGQDLGFSVSDPRDKTRYEFSGRIEGAAIAGSVRVAGPRAQRQLEWAAVRTEPGSPAHAALKKPTLQELQLVQ